MSIWVQMLLPLCTVIIPVMKLLFGEIFYFKNSFFGNNLERKDRDT